jgi:site-specific recombinase XerD
MRHNNAPAPRQRPGADTRRSSPDAGSTLPSPEALAQAAKIRRDAVRNKTYRSTFVGQEAGRFLRSMKWAERSPNSLDTYEIPLQRLSLDFAHLKSLDEFTTDDVREFLDSHWGDCAPATRRNRLAIIRSFFQWAVDEDRMMVNPAAKIKSPKRSQVDRQAYSMDLVDQLVAAQNLRDGICIQLLGRLALRKDELRQLRVGDFNLSRGTVRIHGKGGKTVILPLGFKALKRDLEIYLVGRGPDGYLLYPKNDVARPMTPPSVHRWFKQCLERAGLPDTIKLHEMRHSAADHLWRQTGNLTMAQQLLRHESPATTAAYLHPTRADLEAALEGLDG